MNLYLVSCTQKNPNIVSVDSNSAGLNNEVYVVASDPTGAENAALILMRGLGNNVSYVNNIRLLASTDEKAASGLLVIV